MTGVESLDFNTFVQSRFSILPFQCEGNVFLLHTWPAKCLTEHSNSLFPSYIYV